MVLPGGASATRMLRPSPSVLLNSLLQSVLLNLVLAVVLEGASDQMKEKHAAQKFRDNTLHLFHNQYKRLAMRRWSAKVQAEAMLERGAVDNTLVFLAVSQQLQ